MTTALILIASGILIGAGLGVIWRDMKRSRRRAFVLPRDAHVSEAPEVEVVISHGVSAAPLPQATAARPAADQVGEPVSPSVRDGADQPAPGDRLSLEQQWLVLKPILSVAVGKVNAVLAPVELSIGASGEPSWSYKNAGYGAHRRVLLGEDSLGWLRLELAADGQFHATLKAHKEDHAEINATTETAAAALNPARATDLLSRCLEPATRYATRAGGGDDEKQASERAWKTVDALVTAALKATNGALQQADARLVPITSPGWEAELKRHRMTLRLEVNGSDVARMHIERLAHEMEVAVGVPDQRLIDLGRRRRIPVEGMTIHALAELIASCAWPTIARFSETRSQADR